MLILGINSIMTAVWLAQLVGFQTADHKMAGLNPG